MIKIKFKPLLILIAFFITFCSCKEENQAKTEQREGKFVVIVVIDGPRYTETWGDSTHKNIPVMAKNMAPIGVVSTAFYNKGKTSTNPGHAAICTGNYDSIANNGKELPTHQSIFQEYLKQKEVSPLSTWIVTTKDKLEVLADTKNETWKGQFMPSTNCGIDGNGSGYRHDSTTFRIAKETIKNHHPNILLINFKEPDDSGHDNDWPGYIQGIKDTDQYIGELWEFIQADEVYKNKTTFIVTNDHGRHLDSVKTGFITHGDDCDGCQHLNFFACGPQIKQGVVLDVERGQNDIAPTIAKILDFSFTNTTGVVMDEIFE
jgi:alkaline phosphatase